MANGAARPIVSMVAYGLTRGAVDVIRFDLCHDSD
jgi:hypothetical protein